MFLVPDNIIVRFMFSTDCLESEMQMKIFLNLFIIRKRPLYKIRIILLIFADVPKIPIFDEQCRGWSGPCFDLWLPVFREASLLTGGNYDQASPEQGHEASATAQFEGTV